MVPILIYIQKRMIKSHNIAGLIILFELVVSDNLAIYMINKNLTIRSYII